MLLLIKILLSLCLFCICIQDILERKVYLILLLICGFLMSYLFYVNSFYMMYLQQILINFSVIMIIGLILFMYSKVILKLPLNKTFGLGDLIFFLIIASGFSTLSFLILFSFSLLFSALVYVFMKSSMKQQTIPLAGFQALFFCLVLSTNWIFSFTNLYQM